MSYDTVTLFFALLAVASFLFVASWVGSAPFTRSVPAVAEVRDRARADLAGSTLSFAAVIATFATLGSLFLSEVIGYPPCSLCWVQRGFMYPLAVLLVVAAATGAEAIRGFARVWALLGAGVSAYHVALERIPALSRATACDVANPCTVRWVEHLGFITIPVMALAAFLLIAVLLSIRVAASERTASEPELVP